MTDFAVQPTPTWQAFEALLGRVQDEGGNLPVEQRTLLHIILMEMHGRIGEMYKSALDQGSGAGIVQAKRLARLACLLRMTLPATDDDDIQLAREWKSCGVEVH